MKKPFRAKRRSAEKAAPQSAESASGAAPVSTTTESGSPQVEWATLTVVPVPQAVPAAPGQYVSVPTALSEVSAAALARRAAAAEASSSPSGGIAQAS